MQLNRLLFGFVLRVLPPALIWLVGDKQVQKTFDAESVPGVRRVGQWRSHSLRLGNACPVNCGKVRVAVSRLGVPNAPLGPEEAPTFELPLVHCFFLAMQKGPRIGSDFEAMGEVLASEAGT